MKKYICLVFLPILFGCSGDDNSTSGEVKIIKMGAGTLSDVKNQNGKYDNVFGATVVNTTNAPVKGHVRFEIKDYGYITSDTETVTNESGFQNTFSASVETNAIIDESYLLGAEFVKN